MNVRVCNAEEDLRPSGGASQSLEVSNSAVGAPAWAASVKYSHVMVDIVGADARVTFDGSDPVGGTSGHLFANGSHFVWNKDLFAVARFIRNASTDLAVYATPLTM